MAHRARVDWAEKPANRGFTQNGRIGHFGENCDLRARRAATTNTAGHCVYGWGSPSPGLSPWPIGPGWTGQRSPQIAVSLKTAESAILASNCDLRARRAATTNTAGHCVYGWGSPSPGLSPWPIGPGWTGQRSPQIAVSLKTAESAILARIVICGRGARRQRTPPATACMAGAALPLG